VREGGAEISFCRPDFRKTKLTRIRVRRHITNDPGCIVGEDQAMHGSDHAGPILFVPDFSVSDFLI
jgi:hypothetical protein